MEKQGLEQMGMEVAPGRRPGCLGAAPGMGDPCLCPGPTYHSCCHHPCAGAWQGASRPALPLLQLPWAACTPPCLLPVYQAHNGISVCRWVRVRPCTSTAPAPSTGTVPGRAPLETVWSLLAKGGACLLLCVLKQVIDLLLSSFPGSNQKWGWAAKPSLIPVPAPGTYLGGRQVGPADKKGIAPAQPQPVLRGGSQQDHLPPVVITYGHGTLGGRGRAYGIGTAQGRAPGQGFA